MIIQQNKYEKTQQGMLIVVERRKHPVNKFLANLLNIKSGRDWKTTTSDVELPRRKLNKVLEANSKRKFSSSAKRILCPKSHLINSLRANFMRFHKVVTANWVNIKRKFLYDSTEVNKNLLNEMRKHEKRWNKESSEKAVQIPAAKAYEHTSPYANLPSTALPRFAAKIDSDLVGALVSSTNSCLLLKTEYERVQNVSVG